MGLSDNGTINKVLEFFRPVFFGDC